MNRLYLASTSPRRREILRAAGIRFTLLRPAPDPPAPRTSRAPAALAIRHARLKALSALRPGLSGLVIGVDTIVVLGNAVLGKPADRDEARRVLLRLSGCSHRVISGLAVHDTDNGHTRTASEESRVTFRRLDLDEIERYLDTGEPFDKAGAYGIQGRAAAFVSRLEGSYSNVVGLPLTKLMALLVACRDGR